MVDRISAETRSRNMSRIRSKDTKPEMQLRRIVYGMGYRYQLHVKSLPGCPDLVFARRRKALFIHGCFWHQHEGCKDSHLPKSRLAYWSPKLVRNAKRDIENERKLRELGWDTLTIWACEITDENRLAHRLQEFLM
jgi:DNA mismatch endonuclease (patch repair protein)